MTVTSPFLEFVEASGVGVAERSRSGGAGLDLFVSGVSLAGGVSGEGPLSIEARADEVGLGWSTELRGEPPAWAFLAATALARRACRRSLAREAGLLGAMKLKD